MKNATNGAPASAGSENDRQLRLAMLAHDLRNVLAVLAGWLDVARRAVDDTERRDALLEAAAVIPRIYELLEQVKVLAPTPTPNPKVNDTTGAAIAETLDAFAAVLPQNIQLMRKVAGDLARVPLSAGQINQVLINLLRNACQAMPQGGALVVMAGNVTIEAEAGPNGSPSSRRTGKFVRLSVVDTGCGIPLEVQKVLFEPYSTTKPLGEGTGLGLASVKSLVEGNGGFVTWRTAPGKGTQCNVYLPAIGPDETGGNQTPGLE
ncbi:MAG: HAMP domain-containing sensor histidine kinase [Verrucomicrobiota bacterium]